MERNAYGRQTESFEAELDAPTFAAPVRGVFIRAPRLTATGPDVEVLARLQGEPVLVCPVHTWSFNLRSGQCTVDDSLRIRRYDTAIEDGRLLIDVSS